MSKRLAVYKLRETTGATILMALLALLVVAMVSTVILSAATSTVRQSKADQELQQTLLDLQMAAELTAKELSGFSVTAVSTSDDGNTWSDPTITSTKDKAYTKAIRSAVKEIYYPDQAVPSTTSLPRSFSIETTYGKATDSSRIKRLVNASFVLSKSENAETQNSLVFTFKTSDAAGGPQLYLTLSGYVNPDTKSTTVGEGTEAKTTYTKTETYAWRSPTFSTADKDGADDKE